MKKHVFVCFCKSCVSLREKSRRQGCTAQKSGSGMRQSYNFQLNLLTIQEKSGNQPQINQRNYLLFLSLDNDSVVGFEHGKCSSLALPSNKVELVPQTVFSCRGSNGVVSRGLEACGGKSWLRVSILDSKYK